MARGLKVLNLCILFLLLSQIGLVTKQLRYLISFANSSILIEAASVHDQCCRYEHNPTPSLCRAAVWGYFVLVVDTLPPSLTFSLTFMDRKRGVSSGFLYRKNFAIKQWSGPFSKNYLFQAS